MVTFHTIKSFLSGNRALLNGSLFSVFSFVNKGFNFVLMLILANYFQPAEYGYISLFVTVIMLLGYFKALSTEGYLSVAYFREGDSGITKTLSCVFFTSVIFVTIISLLTLVFGNKLSVAFDLPINVLFIAILTTFFTLYSNVLLDYIRIREKVGLYGLISCGSALFNVALTVFLVVSLDCGWLGRVYSMLVCAAIVGVISLLWFFKKHYIGIPNTKYWLEMLKWGIPLIPHLGASFIRQGCDRYIINASHSIEDVGLFSFALTLSTIITMVGYGFNQSNSVDIYKCLGSKLVLNSGKAVRLRKMRKSMFLIYTVITIILIMVSIILIPLFFPAYAETIKYFPFLAIYSWEVCVYLIYTNYLFYYKETKHLMYITLSSAVLHLMLSLLFTRYSLLITCVLYCITQLIVVLLTRRKALQLIKIKLAINV